MPLAPIAALTLALLAGAAAGWGAGRQAGTPDVKVVNAGELKSILAQARGTATLVHVWATWCPPCREEFPNIVRVHEAYAGRGLDLILVSADAPTSRSAVVSYLTRQGAVFPSYMIDNPDAVFIDTLCTNWSGALPASFFLGPDGALLQWWEGKTNYAAYQQTADAVLKQTHKTEAGTK